MQLSCSQCGATVQAADVNLDRLLAKCAQCNHIFAFAPPGGAPGAGALARRMVPMPPQLTIVADGATGADEPYRGPSAGRPRLVIERRWYTPALFFFVFFCLFWDGFLVFWYAMALKAWILPALVFPVLHLAVGVVLTYRTICGFVNRTRIAIEHETLTVRHGPLPWPGARSIATSDLAQLYCEEHHAKKGQRSFSLAAMLRSGAKVTLLEGLPEPDQALYLEQLIESRLAIEDVPVAGSLR